MINSVRNEVNSVLNKHNYGALPVSDFNSYSHIIQLEIYTRWFRDLNIIINLENKGKSGIGLANAKKVIEGKINRFIIQNVVLAHDADNKFKLPSILNTGHDYYMLTTVSYYDALSKKFKAEMELIQDADVLNLISSKNSYFSESFPAYKVDGTTLHAYPDDKIIAAENVRASYLRYPTVPKWTYKTIIDGEPLFDATASDYNDFEITPDEEDDLVEGIARLAGVTLREDSIVSWATRKSMEADLLTEKYKTTK